MLTDGERWTEDQLTQLRMGFWRPTGQIAFLVAAQARANATRRRCPALARQERDWILGGAATWLVLGQLCPDGVFRRVQTRGLVWWGGCAMMLDWHLGLLETPTGRPVGLGLADALTLMRAWLVPAVAEVGDHRLVLIGALSDIGDGRVARATRCTRFGRDLEGLVDACFFLAALHGAVAAGHLSPRRAALERRRLLAGSACSVGGYLATGRAPDDTLRQSGRSAAPIRNGALIAAGLGRQRLADFLLLAGTSVAAAGLLRDRFAGTARGQGERGPPSSAAMSSVRSAAAADCRRSLLHRARRRPR